eukprot:7912119-Pyramimonas_sp.AAC.1
MPRPGAAAARAALKLCTVARSTGQLPEPAALADSILSLAKAEADMFASPCLPPRGKYFAEMLNVATSFPWQNKQCGWSFVVGEPVPVATLPP